MHRHLVVVIGRWKFENWHLYVEGWSHSTKKPSNRWRVWRRLF